MAKKRQTRSGPKEWSPRKEVQSFAQKFAEGEAVMPKGFMYTGDLPIGDTWGYVFGRSRDSDLVEESNWDVIKADLEERFPDDVQEERHSHFLVGWVDQLAVRLLDKNGIATPAADAAYEWKQKLEAYPLADEDDHTKREYAATIENIQSEGHIDEDLAEEVFSWLWENNQSAVEPRDGGGGYPQEEDIQVALWEIGKPTEEMIEERQDEEDEEKASMTPDELETRRRKEYTDPPWQGRLFGRRLDGVGKEWQPGPERLVPMVGRCVRFRRDVERFPNFMAKAGMSGKIDEYGEDHIAVRVHQDLGEGAEEWENHVIWREETLDEFLKDVKVIAQCPGDEE